MCRAVPCYVMFCSCGRGWSLVSGVAAGVLCDVCALPLVKVVSERCDLPLASTTAQQQLLTTQERGETDETSRCPSRVLLETGPPAPSSPGCAPRPRPPFPPALPFSPARRTAPPTNKNSARVHGRPSGGGAHSHGVRDRVRRYYNLVWRGRLYPHGERRRYYSAGPAA